MSSPTPALVTRRAARRLPRIALLLLCAAYVLPGVFGRDPWRNADITAFGYMVSLAEGRSDWLLPSLGGWPAEAALLPHWLGALFVALLSPWLDAALAARLPFAALLALVLACTWYTTFPLARTDAAQPVAFAFGGEAETIDYARAIAAAAVLALIATLGLLQLGH
jgi:4-amino-4-deoxy-L-arabinose transferase-like glycosyltransferase